MFVGYASKAEWKETFHTNAHYKDAYTDEVHVRFHGFDFRLTETRCNQRTFKPTSVILLYKSAETTHEQQVLDYL